MQEISATLWDQIIKSKDKTLFLSEDLTATIWQKNCTNVDFTYFHLPLDHFILGTNRKWPPFFDWKCGGWKLHLLREIFIMYSIVTKEVCNGGVACSLLKLGSLEKTVIASLFHSGLHSSSPFFVEKTTLYDLLPS